MKEILKNNRLTIIMFILGLALGAHVGYITNSLLHKNMINAQGTLISENQKPLKIIHEIILNLD